MRTEYLPGVEMDIENINRRHYIETDMYYRVGYGLTSKLLSYEHGIFHLEVTIGKRWEKSHNSTSSEMAYCWKNTHPELAHAIGCKVFIIDAKNNEYKQYLIHKGMKPGYDAKKGILFSKNLSN